MIVTDVDEPTLTQCISPTHDDAVMRLLLKALGYATRPDAHVPGSEHIGRTVLAFGMNKVEHGREKDTPTYHAKVCSR
jgi:hypothetical protein